MNRILGIGTASRRLFQWFGGLTLSAKAAIVTAAFVIISAGIVIGVAYTPGSVPRFTPTVVPYETLQTPSPLNASIVVAASPDGTSSSPGRSGTTRPSVTSS